MLVRAVAGYPAQMDPASSRQREPLRRMADGTVKQLNPYSGTSVWTVPRRGNRPLAGPAVPATPLDPGQAGRHCAFCERRYLETPPEKARLEHHDDGRWALREGLSLEQVGQRPAEVRRIANLFEIVGYDYWRLNYGYHPGPQASARCAAYLADPVGRAHVLDLLRVRARAEGTTEAEWAALPEAQRLALGIAFFAGGHDVVVARRHFVEGATHDDQLASAGTLSVDEHRRYVGFTVAALSALYDEIPYARYVAVFQNWLRPAGASFDHLHKQLVAIDEHSARMELELGRLRVDPDFYNHSVVDYAAAQGLVVAENAHAVAFAGFGHRYPSLEVFAKARTGRPWDLAPDELDGVADLLHACHAATGPSIPTNEEWHHQMPGLDLSMPWRIVLKWRVSTVAGFEGGTKIYLNTVDPWHLRDRVVERLQVLAAEGALAPGVAVGADCPARPNSLRYTRAADDQ